MKKTNIECFNLSKTKVEVWMILVLFICCSFVFLYLNSLPTPSTDSIDGSRSSSVKLKNDLKECEEKSTQTILYLADRLTELTDLRQKVDEMESSSDIGSLEDNIRIAALEDELRRLKKPKLDIKPATLTVGGVSVDSNTVVRRTLEVSNYLPTYDSDTIGTNPSYPVTTDLQCWAPECSPENLNNREAYAECELSLATTWNALGVKNMERFVAIGKRYPTITIEQYGYLTQALYAFDNATTIDPQCSRAFINLAMVLMQFNKAQEALDTILMVQEQELNKSARNWAILGFIQDFAKDRDSAIQSWKKAMDIDPLIGERKYFGIMVVSDNKPERHFQDPLIRETSKEIELPMARDVLTYIEFSPVSVANFATVPPGSQEFFVKTQFIILRDIIPPFVLRSVAYSFQQLREKNLLHLGDHQSKRYSAYNSRVGRTLHYQLVDLLRRVILHNVQPSYSFYGGYLPGALLPPHSDKPQCEFTVTLTLQQTPEETKPWAISLGKIPNFERDDKYGGSGAEPLPPEDEIVDAYLYPGDCLLFMGRHLTHFRRVPLPDNNFLDQIFLHHVQDSFEGYFDI